MTHSLSSNFHYVTNRATNKGYIVSPAGGHSVVNVDAMELLTSTDASWQTDPDYAAFLDHARALNWLVDRQPEQPAKLRDVDNAIHLMRIQYEINLLCNLKCMHCYCSSSPHADAGLPTEFVLDLVRQAADLGVLYFDVTGGEPLARRDIMVVLESIATSGMVPSLFTNCTLVTKRVAERLRDIGVSAIQTSLDAATPEVHDRIRGQQGAFARAIRGIEALKAARVPLSVSVTLNRLNAGETSAVVHLLRDELQVPFYFDRVIPAGRSREHGANLELTNQQFYSLIRSIEGETSIPTGKVCDSPNPAASASKIDPACGVGATFAFIKHDGRMALCPTLTEAESPDFRQADLKRVSLKEAWERHPTFARFRGMQCENASVCPSGKQCRGGCRSNAYLLHGRIDSPDEMSCNVHKNENKVYRSFLEEYEAARAEGRLPARPLKRDVAARRRLTVFG